MSSLLFLQSLVKKNESYRHYFKKSQLYKISLLEDNKISTKFTVKCTGEIHWKKLFRARYQSQNCKVQVENDVSLLSKSWNLDLLFRTGGKDRSGSMGLQSCKSLDDRHQIQENVKCSHFDQIEELDDGCYLAYFSDPAKFMKEGSIDCLMCQKGLSGISRKVDLYLEGLRNKRKTKDERVSYKAKTSARRICVLCSKILSNRKGLERHMLIHTGEKPFPCDICQKPFRRKDNCARHKKTAHLFKKPRKPRRRRDNHHTNRSN